MVGVRAHFQNNRKPILMKRRCGILSWEGAETIIIGDFEGVVEDERLELREEQAQLVRKKGIVGEKQVLSARALMEAVISGHRQLKLKENKDTGSITVVGVLEIHETNVIRDLYRAICEIPDNPNGIELVM